MPPPSLQDECTHPLSHASCCPPQTVKAVTLELGGKSPLIIWKDANLDEAVEVAHMSLFFNHVS